MSDILAPIFIGFIGLIIVTIFVGAKVGAERAVTGALILIGVLVACVVVALAVWSNWSAFIDPPEACWKGSGQRGWTNRRLVPWEECRAQMIWVAIAVDVLIVSALGGAVFAKLRK